MDEFHPYPYQPVCDVHGCDRTASHKVAAPWSDGAWSELKNYGTYCGEHAYEQLEVAREKQRSTRLSKGEQVGPVQLYELVEGRRDAELMPVS